MAERTSLHGIQDYVATMEVERGLDKQDIPSQCLKLSEDVGELFRAVRKFQTTRRTLAGGSPMSATKPSTH